MKTKLIKPILRSVALAAALLVHSSFAGDLTIDGNLNVNSNQVVNGSLTISNNFNWPGGQLVYTNISAFGNLSLFQLGNRSLGILNSQGNLGVEFETSTGGGMGGLHLIKSPLFIWEQGIQSVNIPLRLDGSHPSAQSIQFFTRQSYSVNGSPDVEINRGNLTAYGTTNTMPNQTLTGPGSILTLGLGDGRYSSVSSPTMQDKISVHKTGGTSGQTAEILYTETPGLSGFQFKGDSGATEIHVGDLFPAALGVGGAQISAADMRTWGISQISLAGNSPLAGAKFAFITFMNTDGSASKYANAWISAYSEDDQRKTGGLSFWTGTNSVTGYPQERLQIQPNGAVIMSGNLAVGTDAPAARFHVNGTSQFEDTATFKSVVRIVPQGDLSMGTFTNSPPQ